MAERILPQKSPTIIAGSARIQIKTLQHPDRWVIVGPFDTLHGATELARALAEDRSAVLSVRVEHRNGNRWAPARSLDLTPVQRRSDATAKEG